jgi:hypothetical protein
VDGNGNFALPERTLRNSGHATGIVGIAAAFTQFAIADDVDADLDLPGYQRGNCITTLPSVQLRIMRLTAPNRQHQRHKFGLGLKIAGVSGDDPVVASFHVFDSPRLKFTPEAPTQMRRAAVAVAVAVAVADSMSPRRPTRQTIATPAKLFGNRLA